MIYAKWKKWRGVIAQATTILKAALALPAVEITSPSSHHIGFPGYCYQDDRQAG